MADDIVRHQQAPLYQIWNHQVEALLVMARLGIEEAESDLPVLAEMLAGISLDLCNDVADARALKGLRGQGKLKVVDFESGELSSRRPAGK